MITRRNLISGAGVGALASLVSVYKPAYAGQAPDVAGHQDAAGTAGLPYRPVKTLNGWTLPYRVNKGVKEFHLVAEEIEHEFAPGSVAKCWGYNGTTPGPTIEAVEGDRVRIFVTNRLHEHTTVHWHGFILPPGMDGVGGLNQPHIQPGETYVYEFDLVQHGTHMYHPHADEMTQMAYGMMGSFIIHPQAGEQLAIDRDYCFLLHNWALHPGTYRPNPAIMVDFDLWTFNSKVFPAIDPLVARTGERIRVRVGNLSMWNHPIHVHGVEYHVTGSDGGRWPRSQWRREVTEIVGVGQMRDIEFTGVAGDWAFHCHMAHHTMNAMGHDIPNTTGVDQTAIQREIRSILPGYMAMGRFGMAEHQEHTSGGMHAGPENTLPMMMGTGPFGNIEMGGMFTVVKVRDDMQPGDFSDPGWYQYPEGKIARRVSTDPNFGNPPRRPA